MCNLCSRLFFHLNLLINKCFCSIQGNTWWINRRKVFTRKSLNSLQVKECRIRNTSKHYDSGFLWIYLTAYYYRKKISIIDVQLGHVQAFENIEIFKVKLRWSKSSTLLQRIPFLVLLRNKSAQWKVRVGE